MSRRLALGLDFGTESARALLVDVRNGEELATSVEPYPHGVIDTALPDGGVRLPPDWALQDAADYMTVLEQLVPAVLKMAGATPGEIVGIGSDFTACTLVAARNDGTPLSSLPEFHDEPHAWTKLWKHHGAAVEAETINAAAARRNERFLERYGGRTSSEWLLAKAWQTLREAPKIYDAAEVFVEAADWVVWQLTGQLSRSACCAGYKGMWSREEGFPSVDFVRSLDPRLESLLEHKLRGDVLPVGSKAGELTQDAAARLGLKPGIPVAVGIIDAHAAVPAGGITAPGPMLIIMGTSTCHLTLSRETHLFPGYAGVVQDGILPGFAGYEAGQSASGDIYAWFVANCVPSSYQREAADAGLDIHALLEQKARVLSVGESGLVALDWWNGNRSVLMDANLSGLIVGLGLDTKPEGIYRALIEATAFGTRIILENFERSGIPITGIVACGGLAERNELLMQIHANVCGRTITLVRSGQASALGAAIFGALAAGSAGGGYDTVQEAAAAMGGLKARSFRPNPASRADYEPLFQLYSALHDLFGRGGTDIMPRLKAIKLEAASRRVKTP